MRLPEDDLLREFVGDPRERIRRWFDPTEPLMTGVVQNQDSYMKGRIGQRAFYDRLPGELEAAFADWAELTGRAYGAIQPYRCEGAEDIVDRDGDDRRDGHGGRRPPAGGRSAGRLRGRDQLPAVPGRGALGRHPRCPHDRRGRADRRAGRLRQPADARSQGRRSTTARRKGLSFRGFGRSRPGSARATSEPAISPRSSTGSPSIEPRPIGATPHSASATRSPS